VIDLFHVIAGGLIGNGQGYTCCERGEFCDLPPCCRGREKGDGCAHPPCCEWKMKP
jgi:hypothetical protein